MLRIAVLILVTIIAGCAHIPPPAPIPCEIKIKGECREMTPAERNGIITRGHGEEVKDTK